MTFLPAKHSAFAVVTTPGTPPDYLDSLLSKKGASKYYTTIPRGGDEWWWIHTETRSVEVYIRSALPTLRGIVVLVFTKSDG